MMFVTDWRLAGTAIGASLVGFFLMSFILKRSQKYFTKQQQLLGQINGHVEEVYAGHNVVKVYNAEKPLNKTFEGLNKKLFTCAWKSQFMSGIMMPLMRFVGNLGYVAAVCGRRGDGDQREHHLRCDRRVYDLYTPVHPAAVADRAILHQPAGDRRGQLPLL
jgi:hypothetical protein